MILGLSVAGCGAMSESRLNPANWFGRSETTVSDTSNPYQDPRALIGDVTELRLEKIPGGAIVRATGVATRQGYYDGELVPANNGMVVDGVLAFHFRVSPPLTATRVSTVRSREIIVGQFLSDQTLAQVRAIQVNGANNALVVRR
ncbi:MAG: hypothetical protein CMH12_04740 [Maritimibacter sp.]|nr:hypothetical protein [Maritimibacter sp.]